MATSGTIGQTRYTLLHVIEKALRRCGQNPAAVTAETLELAREDLFLLTMSLSNRGINLWCVDTQTVPLVVGQATYVLPVGTIDVLNMLLATPTGVGAETTDIPVTPLNRDDYSSLPNKSFRSSTPVNYYFEKLLAPQITLWPVPSDDTKFLKVYRYRQIQDMGAFTDDVEVPVRWFEAITWHLALRLAFELPDVKQERVTMIQAMAQSMTLEADMNETDNAPVYFAPNISPYTR